MQRKLNLVYYTKANVHLTWQLLLRLRGDDQILLVVSDYYVMYRQRDQPAL